MNRRQGLLFLAGASAVAANTSLLRAATLAQPVEPFKLPPLGYPYNALEPHIDATTMMIHHDRHHAAYVNAWNQLVPRWPGLASTPMETILADLSTVPKGVRTGVRNNLGGDWNHTFFWELMTPGGQPARWRPQRPLQGGVPERPLVPDPCRRRRKVGGLAQILQRGAPAWGDRAQGPDLVAQSRWRRQPAIVRKPGNSTFRWSRKWYRSTSIRTAAPTTSRNGGAW